MSSLSAGGAAAASPSPLRIGYVCGAKKQTKFFRPFAAYCKGRGVELVRLSSEKEVVNSSTSNGAVDVILQKVPPAT